MSLYYLQLAFCPASTSVSPVIVIPPLLHTHPSIYHPRCIMFFSQYFSFPCHYHSTIAPYSSLSTCCFSQKDKVQELSEKQCSFGNREALDSKVCSVFTSFKRPGDRSVGQSPSPPQEGSCPNLRPVYVETVVDKTDSGTSFVPVSLFSPVIIAPPVVHQHVNPHANLFAIRDADGRSLQASKEIFISGENTGCKGI